MKLLHYRRQTINLRQINNLVRTSRDDDIIITSHLRGKLSLVEKRHLMPTLFKPKSKILHRDIRTAVIGKRIFIDGDFHF